jgi:D-alanyl-D-alanine carboxypeptidase/D-alanyl-D-alanine-endopeptidase (penicillin-binding protein 4)
MNKRILFFLIFIFSPLSLFSAQRSVVLFDLENNRPLYLENEKTELIPASTIKVLTALISIEKFGLDYRFFTKVFEDDKNNIYIKGFGDPLFTSDEIKKFCQKLSLKLKTRKINNIIIDQTFFSQESINFEGTKRLSSNTYDSPNNALAANFNSVCFEKKGNTYISCEKETPLLKEILFLVKNSKMDKGRIPIPPLNNANLLYPGYLIKYFLEKENIIINGKVKLFTENNLDNLKEIFHYNSDFTLKDTIEKMLFYSNNFIANQLFLCIGEDENKASIEKSADYYKKYLADNKINAHVIEGSGISRENKISGDDMIKILKKFKPYYLLMKKDSNGNFYKTGTLTGVKNLCGYYFYEKDKIFLYSIFLNNSSLNPFNEFSVLKEKIKKNFINL